MRSAGRGANKGWDAAGTQGDAGMAPRGTQRASLPPQPSPGSRQRRGIKTPGLTKHDLPRNGESQRPKGQCRRAGHRFPHQASGQLPNHPYLTKRECVLGSRSLPTGHSLQEGKPEMGRGLPASDPAPSQPDPRIPKWGHLAWREGPGRAGRLLARPKAAQKEVGEEVGGKNGETFSI